MPNFNAIFCSVSWHEFEYLIILKHTYFLFKPKDVEVNFIFSSGTI